MCLCVIYLRVRYEISVLIRSTAHKQLFLIEFECFFFKEASISRISLNIAVDALPEKKARD